MDASFTFGHYRYARLRAAVFSKCHRFMAFTLDTTGDERFTLHVRDTARPPAGSGTDDDATPGHVGPSHWPAGISECEWTADGALLYTQENERGRPCRVMRHLQTTAPAEDQLGVRITLSHKCSSWHR